VLLLDEIEKAHPDVYNILLQIMDHGKLTDTNGREADFRNVILVMTTNAGAQQSARRSIGFTEQENVSDSSEAIRRTFTPEFRNRLDGVIQFSALDFSVVLLIVDKFIMELEAQLALKDVSISVSNPAREWLAEQGFDPEMGARPMKRVIQNKIKRPLADDLLFGVLSAGGEVDITLSKTKGKQLKIRSKPKQEPRKALPAATES
jgi:ATP-dependent Clp protease ATP-binding subunit ClpA